MKFEIVHTDETADLVEFTTENTFKLGERSGSFELTPTSNGFYVIHIDGKTYDVYDVHYEKNRLSFQLDGTYTEVIVKDEQALLLESMGFKAVDDSGQGQLNAPMPGKILHIAVAVGDKVELGQPIVVLEAMKMENELKAPVSGEVSNIAVEVGQSIEKNELILEIA